MRDYILMFALALILWAWMNLHVWRSKQLKRIQKETSKSLLKQLKDKQKSFKHRNRNAKASETSDGSSIKNGRFKMSAYPYLQEERREGRERRNSRVPVGITFEYIDRRQADHTPLKGFERRNGMERRGLFWDRRIPKLSCYK